MKNAMSNMLKTKSGRWVKLPTNEENETIRAAAISDPDAPLLTDEQMAGMQPLPIFGNSLVDRKTPDATRDYLNKGARDA
jgi:hypothetical protein